MGTPSKVRMAQANSRLRAAGGVVKTLRLRPRAYRALLLARALGEYATDQAVVEAALVHFANSFIKDREAVLRDAPHKPVPLGVTKAMPSA